MNTYTGTFTKEGNSFEHMLEAKNESEARKMFIFLAIRWKCGITNVRKIER